MLYFWCPVATSPSSTKYVVTHFSSRSAMKAKTCWCVWGGRGGNILLRTDMSLVWQETNVSFKCCISHIGNCNEFVCTSLPSSQCQAKALEHLRLPYKIKCNATPSSRMVHKSSIQFAWTVANSSVLHKYKPNSEYYVRDRDKAI